MSGIQINNQFEVVAPKAIDDRSGKFLSGTFQPWASAAEFFAAIPAARRSIGIPVLVGASRTAFEVYELRPGTANNGWDLIPTTVPANVQSQIDALVTGKADVAVLVTHTGTTWSSTTQPWISRSISAPLTLTITGGTSGVTKGQFILTNTGSFPVVINSQSVDTKPNGKTIISIWKDLDGTWAITSSYMAGGVDTTNPLVVSATVENATPTKVDIVFSEAMKSPLPTFSAFAVAGHSVSSIAAITTSHWQLTVNAFSNGEVRALSYTQPGSNNAQDLASNLLASFTGEIITNNVGGADTTAPTVNRMEAIDDHHIEVEFDEIVNLSSSGIGWDFSQNLGALTIVTVTGSGTTILTFEFVETLLNSDTLLGNYDHTTGDTVDTATTPNELVDISAYPVINSVPGSGSTYGGVGGAVFHINAKPANLSLTGLLVDAATNLAGTGTVTGTGASRPSYLAASGTSFPDLIYFNGNSGGPFTLTCPSLTFASTQDITVMMVFSLDSSAGTAVMAEMGINASVVDGFGIYQGVSTRSVSGYFEGDVGISHGQNIVGALNEINFAIFNLHKSLSSNEATVELNGSLGTVITSNNNTNGFTSQILTLGCRSGGSLPGDFLLAEMLIFPRILSPTEKSNLFAQAVTDYGVYTTAF